MIGSGLDDLFIPGDDDASSATLRPIDVPTRSRLAAALPQVVPPSAHYAAQPSAAYREPPGVAAASRAASSLSGYTRQNAGGQMAPQPATAPPGLQGPTREQRLTAALHTMRRKSEDVEAAALVSLDGFIMASALSPGMHEDRVAAMSAAILGLGERAAIELGRGRLSQVFIEGDTGYVLIMASGNRAVLTVLARHEAKLGLLLYDMRDVADSIAGILG